MHQSQSEQVVQSQNTFHDPSVDVAIQAAEDQKAFNIKRYDLHQKSDLCDHFVVVSGTSERHAQGIADKIRDALRDTGERPIAENGYQKGEWIILDYGNLMIHVFYEPTRQYYEVDELWHC